MRLKWQGVDSDLFFSLEILFAIIPLSLVKVNWLENKLNIIISFLTKMGNGFRKLISEWSLKPFSGSRKKCRYLLQFLLYWYVFEECWTSLKNMAVSRSEWSLKDKPAHPCASINSADVFLATYENGWSIQWFTQLASTWSLTHCSGEFMVTWYGSWEKNK